MQSGLGLQTQHASACTYHTGKSHPVPCGNVTFKNATVNDSIVHDLWRTERKCHLLSIITSYFQSNQGSRVFGNMHVKLKSPLCVFSFDSTFDNTCMTKTLFQLVFASIFILLFIESALTFSCICPFGYLTLKNKKRLDCIVRMCSKIVGINLDELALLYRARALRKAQAILTNCTHPLWAEYNLLPSGCSYALLRWRKNRLKNCVV